MASGKITQSHIDALTEPGRELWDEINGNYPLNVGQRILLLEAARCKDRLDVIDASMAGKAFVDWPPSALTASNTTSNNLAKLLASLRLGDIKNRGGRGEAVRGAYAGTVKQTALEKAMAKAA